MYSQLSGELWANRLSDSVSPWPDARRAAGINISASNPLCYLLKGGMWATKAARQTGLERATLYRERGIMHEPLAYDLEQILR
jgi:hypothetical protein